MDLDHLRAENERLKQALKESRQAMQQIRGLLMTVLADLASDPELLEAIGSDRASELKAKLKEYGL